MSKHLNCYPNGKKSPVKVFFQENKVKASSGAEYDLGKYLNKGRYTTSFKLSGSENRILKLLHFLNATQIERFKFECEVLSKIDHQHILKVHDVGEVETKFGTSVPFMVTELLEGSLLGHVNKNGPLDIPRFSTFTIQLCEAVKHLHDQGIVHRDIKPGTLFYQEDRLVLGEFGLARTVSDEGAGRFCRVDSSEESEKVRPSEYMSPELIEYVNGEEATVDFRSDIFQIGSVLFFFLTGEPSRGEQELLVDHLGAKYANLIARCRHHNAEERFASVNDLMTELKAVQDEPQIEA